MDVLHHPDSICNNDRFICCSGEVGRTRGVDLRHQAAGGLHGGGGTDRDPEPFSIDKMDNTVRTGVGLHRSRVGDFHNALPKDEGAGGKDGGIQTQCKYWKSGGNQHREQTDAE